MQDSLWGARTGYFADSDGHFWEVAWNPHFTLTEDTYPRTPDGRYFVVWGRLWRCANPALDDGDQAGLTAALMYARRAVGAALKQADQAAL